MPKSQNFPRDLADAEHLPLLWVLPEGKAGYKEYRDAVLTYRVVARGRRGEGNYILAPPEAEPDTLSPLPPVIALGAWQDNNSAASVVVRERLGDQIEFEITAAMRREKGSWTLSVWRPGDPCPQCGLVVRMVEILSVASLKAVLTLCPRDERIWVHDCTTEINHPIPHTNYYTDVMLVRKIRDPKIALDFHSLFQKLPEFSDGDLARAFLQYNQFKRRVMLGADTLVSPARGNVFSQLLGKLKPTP
jgi:hypothetical protein